ncbi:MAG TPA: nucleotidyltransferase family protein [Thermoanaerobaculia bacterium]|nr:nucleotidyltransferase family protein [Thermoanaerobaculia bacterium]
MTPEDSILYLCCRQEFLPEHREGVGGISRQRPVRWESLAAAAERHGVAPVVGENLRRCDAAALRIPPAVAERLELAFFENAVTKEREAERLAAALVRLREVGYEAILLKGAALDLLVYREPWVVVSRDVDLVLRPLPGRTLDPEEKAVRRALYRSGIECDLLTHHDVTMNGVLPVRFDSVWEEARPIRFREAEALVMGPEDLFVSLCINLCRKRFARLKGLFDVAESARLLPCLDWDRLARRAREHGCEGIVYTALLATRETLGVSFPAGLLDELGVSAARAWAVRRLLRHGGGRSSVLLPYLSYRGREAWRSFRFALTHRAPEHHRGTPEQFPQEALY